MAKKSSYNKAILGLPLWLKVVLALPVFDWIVYGLYRIFGGHIIAGIIWIIFGWNILWIVDIITIVLHGKPTVFA